MPDIVDIKSLVPALQNRNISRPVLDIDNTTFIGIDFGTSTTVVSIARLNREKFIIETDTAWLKQKLIDGTIVKSDKIPSVIAYYENIVLIGTGAADLKHFLKKGVNVWFSFKMELGEDLGAKYYKSELNGPKAPYTIINPKDAAILFFNYLKTQIDKYIEENHFPSNKRFSVSIPASFEANQRRELIEALELNGIALTKQSLIDEPNAAFLSYIQQSSVEGNPLLLPTSYNLNVLVFDFGAGTCDISILEIGRNINGIYSKNVAISRYEKLGGDDIDQHIALNLLLPQLLEQNNLQSDSFREREIYEGIIPKLLKPAEQLKIEICKKTALKYVAMALPILSMLPLEEYLNTTILIDTRLGLLKLQDPRLSYKAFSEIMDVFTSTKKHIESEECNSRSIFSPVKSALKKSGFNKDKIDYVLLIGGSSKNPYIQEALRRYFAKSEILIPRDLQTHVSSGAAIHSLIYNAFNKNIIQPITSEPLILLTKDQKPKVIIKAGTEIPSELIVIDDLVTDRENQSIIELPIFVGTLNKLLYNIKIYCGNDKGFKINTRVKIEMEVNADKLLLVRATAGNIETRVEALNPFANAEMSPEARRVFKAEKQVNLSASQNEGKPSKDSLIALAAAYEQVGKYLNQAETLELLLELYPNQTNYNNIGVAYSNAGHDDKAIKYYEKDYKESKSVTVVFNLAMKYQDIDPKRFKELINEAHQLDPNNTPTLIEL
jgi:molecular chaperone DnaK (HSP70)